MIMGAAPSPACHRGRAVPPRVHSDPIRAKPLGQLPGSGGPARLERASPHHRYGPVVWWWDDDGVLVVDVVVLDDVELQMAIVTVAGVLT